MSIPLRQIDNDPRFQVRLQWDPATDDGLTGLAASLTGAEGLIHPIVVVRLVQPTTFGRTYALITGHRRLAAARRLGWETILARVLPPCDLALPQHQLHLLAITVRENTEREDLSPADRRTALQRLEALYIAVHPEAASRRRGSGSAETPPSEPFPCWAARVTKIPAHTIRRDLRSRLFTGGLPLVPTATLTTAPIDTMPGMPAPDMPSDPVQVALYAAQHASISLQTLGH
jgi:ParB family chromosome partitioning protein